MKHFAIYFPLFLAADWLVLDRHYTALIEHDVREILFIASSVARRYLGSW